jgi:hypothetical protein
MREVALDIKTKVPVLQVILTYVQYIKPHCHYSCICSNDYLTYVSFSLVVLLQAVRAVTDVMYTTNLVLFGQT